MFADGKLALDGVGLAVCMPEGVLLPFFEAICLGLGFPSVVNFGWAFYYYY